MWRSWRGTRRIWRRRRGSWPPQTNRRIIPLAADVTSKEQVERMVAEAAQQLGGLAHPGQQRVRAGGLGHRDRPDRNRRRRGFDRGFQREVCRRAALFPRGHPVMKKAGWGRIINISGGNARNAGNLSGGARNAGLVHMTKTLAVQLGRHGITVNCIHPGTTRTERTPSLLAARATQLGVSPEEAERRTSLPTRRAAIPSAAWWTLRRSPSSRSSWPRKRPGPSPASWLRQAAGLGGEF